MRSIKLNSLKIWEKVGWWTTGGVRIKCQIGVLAILDDPALLAGGSLPSPLALWTREICAPCSASSGKASRRQEGILYVVVMFRPGPKMLSRSEAGRIQKTKTKRESEASRQKWTKNRFGSTFTKEDGLKSAKRSFATKNLIFDCITRRFASCF